MQWWISNGFDTALDNYGVNYLADVGPYASSINQEQIQIEFREKFPESHKQFVRNLDMYWENETHFACHAHLPPDMDHVGDPNFDPHKMATIFYGQDFLVGLTEH